MSDNPRVIVEVDGPHIDHWNYRARTFTTWVDVPGVEPSTEFEIIEVYYTAAGEIVAWGVADVHGWESLDDLRGTLGAMLEATAKPVLTNDDLPGVE